MMQNTKVPAPLSDMRVLKVCKRACGKDTCKFLAFKSDSFQHVCTKGLPIKSIKKLVKDTTAQGDNCSGPPSFTADQTEVNLASV